MGNAHQQSVTTLRLRNLSEMVHQFVESHKADLQSLGYLTRDGRLILDRDRIAQTQGFSAQIVVQVTPVTGEQVPLLRQGDQELAKQTPLPIGAYTHALSHPDSPEYKKLLAKLIQLESAADARISRHESDVARIGKRVEANENKMTPQDVQQLKLLKQLIEAEHANKSTAQKMFLNASQALFNRDLAEFTSEVHKFQSNVSVNTKKKLEETQKDRDRKENDIEDSKVILKDLVQDMTAEQEAVASTNTDQTESDYQEAWGVLGAFVSGIALTNAQTSSTSSGRKQNVTTTATANASSQVITRTAADTSPSIRTDIVPVAAAAVTRAALSEPASLQSQPEDSVSIVVST